MARVLVTEKLAQRGLDLLAEAGHIFRRAPLVSVLSFSPIFLSLFHQT